MIRKYVDQIVFVRKREISSAILMLMEKSKLVVEGAGAVGLAALLFNRVEAKDLPGPIVMVLSGGNIDTDLIEKIMKKRASWEALLFWYNLR